mgnify:CR=1 FL=1
MLPGMRTKKSEEPMIRCSIKLPETLWREARIRALDERDEFQRLVARALELYLKTPLKRQGQKTGD